MKIYENLTKEIENSLAQVNDMKSNKEKYTMIISKEVEDRAGDVVLVSGVDFKNYKKNPIVLVDHDYRIEKIVGKTKNIKVEGKTLVAEFSFVDTETGRLAEKLYNEGFLKASSIGFIPKERSEDRKTITKSELLEWSLVAVPCNADALSLDKKEIEEGIEKGLILVKEEPEQEEAEETEDELKQIRADLSEIKSMLKLLTDNKENEERIEEIKEKKATIQSINNALSLALQNIKKI